MGKRSWRADYYLEPEDKESIRSLIIEADTEEEAVTKAGQGMCTKEKRVDVTPTG